MQQLKSYDVVIMGGGLAGLTLALQIKQTVPNHSILVLERRAHPVPLAAHKVGESSVELAAHYFANVLGLKEHLQQQQLKKFGFRFFFSDGKPGLENVTELGASTFMSTPSYQIDRGIFENHLGELARSRDIEFVDAAMVKNFQLPEENSDAPHSVEYEHEGIRHHVQSRWLLDASGRVGLIKRKLGLAEQNAHNANAVWFRVDTKLDVNEWSQDQEWLNRCNPPNRWLSTNHLVGDGYWLWLIPLASGAHSVGIVCDANLHPIDTMNTQEKALSWIEKHQPRLHQVLKGLDQGKYMDFAFFKRFSYGCKQVFDGARRWALTGEAGLFLDPFYSPGSDYIAMGNTFITELIRKDAAQEPVAQYARIYDRILFQFYEGMLPLYVDQYRLFGDAKVMPLKVIWDYAYYWGVMCQLFFQNKLTDLRTMSVYQPQLEKTRSLNDQIQAMLREWNRLAREDGSIEQTDNNPRQMLDQTKLPWFFELSRGLGDKLDDAGFKSRMLSCFAQLDTLAQELMDVTLAHYPEIDVSKLRALLADAAPRDVSSPSLLFANSHRVELAA